MDPGTEMTQRSESKTKTLTLTLFREKLKVFIRILFKVLGDCLEVLASEIHKRAPKRPTRGHFTYRVSASFERSRSSLGAKTVD